MEWNSNLSSFVSSTASLPSSNSFLYSYNYNHFPGTNDQKYRQIITISDKEQALVNIPPPADHKIISPGGCCNMNNNQEKKKRLTSEQLDLLERSFQEEIKLDPDRKMKLSRELGLQPRQIAVWFQNRRARWKNKQLEHLYVSLRQEFDVVSREKQLLEEEVTKLKTILKERGSRKKQAHAAPKEVLMDETETVGSTSAAGGSSGQSQNPDHIHTSQMELLGKEHNLDPMASLNCPVLLTYY